MNSKITHLNLECSLSRKLFNFLPILIFLITTNVFSQSFVFDLSGQNLSFLTANKTIVTGSALGLTAGSVHRYDDVVVVEGRTVYVKVEILPGSTATLTNFDDDTSTAGAFQPVITGTAANGIASVIKYRFEFFDTATNFPVYLYNFNLSGLDIDGTNSNQREFYQIKEYASYQVNNPTGLTISNVGGFTQFLGLATSLPGITFENSASFIAFYNNPRTFIDINLGTTGNQGNRQFSMRLGIAPGPFTTPVVTNNPNPTITDLQITKVVDITSPEVGTSVIFNLTAKNNGPSNATVVKVSDILPSGYTYISSTPPVGTTYDSTTGIWNIGALSNAAQTVLTITATVKETGNYVNSAGITGFESDTDLSNNSATATPIPRNPPIAVNDNYSTNEDTAVALLPLRGDSDPDGTTPTIQSINGTVLTPGTAQTIAVTNGTVNITALGVITFTPALNYNGSVTFPYVITDGTLTATANQVITVTAVNDAPVAVTDNYTTNEDTAVALLPLTGDSDPDGTTPTIQSINGTALTPGTAQSIAVTNGTTNITALGVITFTPALNFNGSVTFPYVITDGTLTATANQVITVTAVNDAPIATNDFTTTPNDVTVIIPVIAGNTAGVTTDTDPEGNGTINSTSILLGTTAVAAATGSTSISIPTEGTYNANSDGTVSFVPNATYTGSSKVFYTIKDNSGAISNAATILVNILPACANSFNTGKLTALSGASSPTMPATASAVTSADNVTMIPTASVIAGCTYSNIGAQWGYDNTQFIPSPQGANSPLAFITRLPDPPLTGSCVGSYITTVLDFTTGNRPKGLSFQLSDVDNNQDESQILIYSNGNLVSYTYTTFGSNGATSSFIRPFNSDGTTPAPTVTSTGTNFVFNGTGSNNAQSNNNLYWNGILQITVDPSVAVDRIELKRKVNSLSGAASVSIGNFCWASSNKAPVAVNDTYTTNEDTAVTLLPLTGDSDPDGTTPTIQSINGTALTPGTVQTIAVTNGTVNITALGVITFTPALNYNGSVTFPYVITDGTLTATANQVITVTAVNDAPVAVNDAATTNEDTAVTLNVTTNDTDVDGTINATTVDLDPATAGIQTTFTVTGEGTYSVSNLGVVTFTPVANYNGTATPIDYTVNDNAGLVSNIGKIAITVTAVNDAPIAVNDAVTTNEDTAVTLNVTTNDTDVDGTINATTVDLDPATAGIQTTFTVTGEGTYTVNNLGVVTFTPVANYNGTATPIDYTVIDNAGLVSNIGKIAITVTPVNDAPVAIGETDSTPEDTTITVANGSAKDLLQNDTDVDGNTLTITQFVIGATTYVAGTTANLVEGNLTINADGSYTFVPALNYNGTVPIATYTVSDGNTGTATATLVITVTPVNDAPVAVDDVITVPEDTPVVLTPLVNDNDPDGTTPTIVSINGIPLTPGTAQTITVPNGIVTVTTAGVITFTPNVNYNGEVRIPYQITDGTTSTGAEVIITVTPVVDPPIATLIVSTPIVNDGTAKAVLALTGIDIDGTIKPDGFIVTTLPNPVQGILYLNDGLTPVNVNTVLSASDAAGLKFRPALGFTGTVTFAYTATDNDNALSAPSIVSILVTNVPPTTADITVTPGLGKSGIAQALPALSGADVDGSVVTYIIRTLPDVLSGVLTLNGVPVVLNQVLTIAESALLRFTPSVSFSGTSASFTVTARDNGGLVDLSPATVTIPLIESPAISIVKTAVFNDENGDGFAQVGETITYNFAITNTGNVDLTNVTVTDGLPGLVLTGLPITTLGVGVTNSAAYSGIYVLTQADINLGSVSNQAIVEATSPSGIIVNDLSDGNTITDDSPTVLGISGCVIEIFNALAPNGNGDNKIFRIRGLECYPDNSVEIYNRWGVLVFEKRGYNNQENAFRGMSEGRVTVRQSDELPEGTYYYILRYKDSAATSFEKAGYLYINR
ncbi:gliding motility-associated C-terminal domain-containing protein [Flavobacterium segetis]|uniref:Gliding motility-associated C-terminal domain-containing protein n=1 Tax=Flavobacterium segetis TaxID=271157 RepID=A0A1M5FE92_9FLAO|nr:Ig-like domain-containing protein [Flavobacterium segetis]SHF89870.1 gliding motility-associated C-terminal domain-containing protein [Flavobacterium segetis]